MGLLIALGDSTIAAYAGGAEVLSFVTWTRGDKHNLADPGDTIAQQKTVWAAASAYHATADSVVIQVGLNDVDPAAASSVAIDSLQDLVDTIIADTPAGCNLLVGKMLPCKARWTTLFGGDAATAQQRWVDINEAIAGNGATPITGVDSRIIAHVPLLDDGDGNLAAAYDTGDHIHPNDAGRAIIGTAWQDALDALYVVSTSTRRSRAHVGRILAAAI